MECEIILLNRENSVFQVHVLNWVHPCQAVNNALSLLPSARVTGRLLHNSQGRMGYCFSSTAALPDSLQGDAGTTQLQMKQWDDFNLLLLQQFSILLLLMAWLLHSYLQKLPEIHLARRMGSLSVSELFSLAGQGAPQAVGLVALISLA